MDSRRWLPRIALLVAVAAWWPTPADNRRIAVDGTVNRLDSEALPSPAPGSLLRHSRNFPSGAKDSFVVPGTDDGAVNREPAIEIDGTTGALFVTWVRSSPNGAQIMLARFDGKAWGIPQALANPDGDPHEPQIRIATSLVHVVWRVDKASAPSTYWRQSVYLDDLTPAYGPENLPVPSAMPAGTGSGPSHDLSYFSVGVPGVGPGDPPRLVTWGVRDEPVPVGCVVVIVLSQGMCAPSAAETHWKAGRLVTGGVSGSNLVYSWWANGVGWSAVDSVPLDSGKSAAEGWRLVDDMLRRESATP